jgi:antitoxin ParD1/3/4
MIVSRSKSVIIKGNPRQIKIMNIKLKPEEEKFIQTQIAVGKYENPEAVISQALKLLGEWEKGYQNWVEETRQKVEFAVEQLDRGEGIDGEVVVERLREKLRQARDNQS